jgi:hypothetical protein
VHVRNITAVDNGQDAGGKIGIAISRVEKFAGNI